MNNGLDEGDVVNNDRRTLEDEKDSTNDMNLEALNEGNAVNSGHSALDKVKATVVANEALDEGGAVKSYRVQERSHGYLMWTTMVRVYGHSIKTI